MPNTMLLRKNRVAPAAAPLVAWRHNATPQAPAAVAVITISAKNGGGKENTHSRRRSSHQQH